MTSAHQFPVCPVCPGCKNEWTIKNGGRFCENCFMQTIEDDTLFILRRRIGNFGIVWGDDGCFIYRIVKKSEFYERESDWVTLPFLPYDITEERLKTLLVFL